MEAQVYAVVGAAFGGFLLKAAFDRLFGTERDSIRERLAILELQIKQEIEERKKGDHTNNNELNKLINRMEAGFDKLEKILEQHFDRVPKQRS